MTLSWGVFLLAVGALLGEASVRLNLKNEETRGLIRELARLTGETMTGAINVSVKDRVERRNKERDMESLELVILAEGYQCASTLGNGRFPTSHGEFQYEERGLDHCLWTFTIPIL